MLVEQPSVSVGGHLGGQRPGQRRQVLRRALVSFYSVD